MGAPPVIFLLYIKSYIVADMGRQLLGGSVPGGTDAARFQHWLLQYRETSAELSDIFASTTECLVNSCPPLSSYWYLMVVFLIVMDNYLGVIPVGIVKTWWR